MQGMGVEGKCRRIFLTAPIIIILTIVCDIQYSRNMKKQSGTEFESLHENLSLELRRGTLVLTVLSQLQQPQYGYSLVEELNAHGIPIEPGTLYPLLRRLESHELLISSWETAGPKPRKYYRLAQQGERMLELLTEEWFDMTKSMVRLLKGSMPHETE